MDFHHLETKKLTLAYEGTPILRNIDLAIPPGKITVLVGANGCGKSTLLRGLARLLKAKSGKVYLDGKDISQLKSKTVAQKLAILSQSPVAPEGLTVRNLVAMGRYPYQHWLQQWSKEDEIKIEEALSITGTTEIAERLLNSLSGGQRQRAWIAMVLAQDTNILLLDEPTTYLDLAHQIELLDLLQQLHETKGKTIVMVLHDLNLACRYADYLVAVKQGKIYTMGSPKQVMTEDMVQEVFGLKCRIIPDPLVHTPMCIPRLCRKKFKKTEGGATNY